MKMLRNGTYIWLLDDWLAEMTTDQKDKKRDDEI